MIYCMAFEFLGLFRVASNILVSAILFFFIIFVLTNMYCAKLSQFAVGILFFVWYKVSSISPILESRKGDTLHGHEIFIEVS